MGTDMLYHAECRVGDKWEVLTGENGNEDFFNFGGERNYDFFDFLSGEPDPDTGLSSRGVEPIVPRRGIPDDYPPMIPEKVLEYGYSWLLLQELVDFPWKEKLRLYRGYIDGENFGAWLNNKRFRFSPTIPKHPYTLRPFPYKEWTVVSNEEMLDLITRPGPIDPLIYTTLEYTRTYYECFPYVLYETIPKLLKYGSPTEIRIVFSFYC